MKADGPKHRPQPDPAPARRVPDLGAPADPGPPPPGTPRRAHADAVRGRYGDALPRRGAVAGGGGHVSSTWRVVVDFDGGSLTAAHARVPGRMILGDLGRETVQRISPAALAELEARAGQLLDHDDTPQAVFTADSMHLLAIVDGDRGYELSPAGPITEGPAAELVRLLHDLAWPEGRPRI